MKSINKLYFKDVLKKIISLFDFFLLKYNFKALILFRRFFISLEAKMVYIVENFKWSIAWDGRYISQNLKKLNLIKAEIDRRDTFKNKIIHFGSRNSICKINAIVNLNHGNKNILTWFHISPNDPLLKYIPYLNKKINLIHTSSQITRNQLIKYGFDQDKIIVIPLGVDLSQFKKLDNNVRIVLKEYFKLPKDKIIIGSFQKDGVGWGEGLTPKLIKGPDIFCEVVKKLNESFDIHVFLTGFARGYIKKKLSEYNIPYTHIYLKNFYDIIGCYNVLDLYIITSRSEGGPKALLECMATGVPVVTTKVGMALDIIKNGYNGFLADINDIEQLYEYSVKIIREKNIKEEIINNSLKYIKNFDWEIIAKQYYHKLYKKLKRK